MVRSSLRFDMTAAMTRRHLKAILFFLAALTPLFADGRVHTSRAGAELAAEVVIKAMRALPGDPLGKFLRAEPAANW